MACTRGSRGGEPGRPQAAYCGSIAQTADYLSMPTSARPPSGDQHAVAERAADQLAAALHRDSASALRQVFVEEDNNVLVESLTCEAPHIRFLPIGPRFTLHASSPGSVTLAQLHSPRCGQLGRGLAPEDRAQAGRKVLPLSRVREREFAPRHPSVVSCPLSRLRVGGEAASGRERPSNPVEPAVRHAR